MGRKAIKRMESFPDATIAEFQDQEKDTTCIICHSDMVEGEGENRRVTEQLKKLPCGHIFKAGCLRRWFLRQQTCPICRRNVLEGDLPNASGNQANAAGNNRNNRPAGNNAQVEAQRIHDLIRNLQQQARNGQNPQNAANANQNPNNSSSSAAPNINISGANISGLPNVIQSEFTISGIPSVGVANVPFNVPVPKPPH